MANPLKVGVVGAGAIGAFVGGRLAATGVDVAFAVRPRARAELEAHDLTLTDMASPPVVVPRGRVVLVDGAAALGACDAVLVCVKSAQTAEVADDLASAFPDAAARPLVVSLQNGVRNPDVLRARLGDVTVGAIVGFNVVAAGEGVYRRTTSGELVLQQHARAGALVDALRAAGFEVEVAADVRPQQWAKLVMNVNNAIGALSDVPTSGLLLDAGYRRVMRALIVETLGAMRAAKLRLARVGPLPTALFPAMLALPTWLLRLAMRAQLDIDPEARSSMWQDLARGRATEVDDLNGEIVRLAEAHGARAPLNANIVRIVHEVEAKKAGSPRLSAEELWSAITAGA